MYIYGTFNKPYEYLVWDRGQLEGTSKQTNKQTFNRNYTYPYYIFEDFSSYIRINRPFFLKYSFSKFIT